MKIVFTILKFVLIWLVIAAVVILGAQLIFDNIMYGVRVLLVLFVIWLLLFIAYKLIQRQAAKRRVSRLVDLKKGDKIEEEDGMWFPFKSYITEDRTLYKRIAKIVAFVNKSKLGAGGSAIYSKPWYLLVGDKGAGKSALLNDSGVSFPVVDCGELKTEDGNLIEFYLTNEAVYIDLSHTYIPGDGEEIPLEFGQLLKALRMHRPKEPINGVILAVNAEELMDEANLETLANKHSFYVNFIMQYAKVQIPVQMMVTHTDNLTGFKIWLDLLSKNQLKEALGNHNVNNLPSSEFVEKTFDVTEYKISKIISLGFSSAKKLDPEVLSFSKEIAQLRDKLIRYTEIVFSTNSYQESSFLTGLYFTGMQTKNTGEKLICFAYSLVTSIFPNDRRRMHMLTRFQRTSWLLSGSFLIGWVSLSFIAIIGFWQVMAYSISGVVDQYYTYNEMVSKEEIMDISAVAEGEKKRESGSIVQRIHTYSFLKNAIDSVHEDESGWLIPWNSLTGYSNVGLNMRAKYYRKIQKELIRDIDKSLRDSIQYDFSELQKVRTSREDSDRKIAEYARLLYKRLSVLKSYLSGASKSDIRNYFPVFTSDSAYFSDVENITLDEVDQVNEIYLQSLFWYSSVDKKEVAKEYEDTKALLAMVIAQGSGDLQWIISWANKSLPNESVDLQDYFIGSGSVNPPEMVDAAYTIKGSELIDGFLVEMQSLFNEKEAFYQRLSLFRDAYVKNYIHKWSGIAVRSTSGLKKLRGRSEWVAVMQQLSNQETNPYLGLLNKMHTETTIIVNGKILNKSRDLALENNESVEAIKIPLWIDLLGYFQRMKQFGSETKEGKSNSKLTKTILKIVKKTGKTGKAIAKAGKKANKVAKKSKFKLKSKKKLDENLEKAAAEFDKLLLAMSDAAFNIEIRSAIYKDIESLFKSPDDPSSGTGFLAKMYSSYKTLQFLVGLENIENEPFWKLIYASIYTAQRFMVRESQAELNDLWGKKILGELNGAPDDFRREDIMFDGQKGLLWTFYKENLEPFLDIKSSGIIVPKVILGEYSMGFTEEFISYYSKARDGLRINQDSYPVFFETGPVSVNKEALFKPVKTTLSMSCGDKNEYTSINLIFYSKSLFKWTSACGDLTLDINFSMFSLTRVYAAPNGFAEFLTAFKGNSLKLLPSDFPDQASNLSDINVNKIILNYNIFGRKELLEGINSFPKNLPNFIAEKWD